MLKILDKIFFLFLFGIVIALVFTYFGWVRLLVVQTGSMSPEMPVNSLLLVVPKTSVFNQEEVYKAGQVISFSSPGQKELITHRIFDVSAKDGEIFYETKGDANGTVDLNPTAQRDVMGRVVAFLPGFGILIGFLSSFLGLFLLVVLPASLVILHEVMVIQGELKKNKFSKAAAASSLMVLLLVVVPTVALFSKDTLLEGNSLATASVFPTIPLECSHITFSGDPIVGNEIGEIINGTEGNDLIFARGGGDKVYGNGGDDCILGEGEGNSLIGGEGNDVLVGGDDSDSLKGGNGNDILYGNDGSDGLQGENGDDTLDGGPGQDSLKGGEGSDSCLNGESVQTCELP